MRSKILNALRAPLDGAVHYYVTRWASQRLIATLYTPDCILGMVHENRHHVMVIAAPKSGSSWLSVVLEELLHWRTNSLVFRHQRREQEIDINQIITTTRRAHLLSVNQHCRCSDATIEWMIGANIKGVVTCRNIFDTVFSYADHLRNESAEIPLAFLSDHQVQNMSQEALLNFVVDMIVPWYFNFYAGWIEYASGRGARVYLSRYEDLLDDPPGQIAAITDWLGFPQSGEDNAAAIEKGGSRYTRKNKAIKGRGKDLPRELVERILKMASYYPDTDFSRAGLGLDLALEPSAGAWDHE